MLGNGCGNVADVGRDFNAGVQVEWYSGGRKNGETNFTAQSQQVSNLVGVLKQFEGKWQADFNSYAPRLMVRSTSGNLNVLQSKLVVNLTRKGRSNQYSVSVPAELSKQMSDIFQSRPFDEAK
jgi:hypothetical protein